METFDDLAADSPAVAQALAALREAAGGPAGPMERHCLRCFHYARAQCAALGDSCDEELLAVAAILHDAGLYAQISRGGVYTADGAAFAGELLGRHGWPAQRIERCAAAIDRHHELRDQRARGTEVEALRRADLTDVSGGLLRRGLPSGLVREVRAAVPRDGLAGELARLVGRALRERPASLPRILIR